MTDLVSRAVGGRIVDFNDEFFAEAENLLNPTEPVWKEGKYTDRGKWMDGWETRRRRDPGHDWCVIALGIPGIVERITLDTSHFTGNYPERFSLDGCSVSDDGDIVESRWVELVGPTDLKGDTANRFQVANSLRTTHVRLNIFPDGGVARLRIEGTPVPSIQDVCPTHPIDLLSSAVGGLPLDASNAHYSPISNMIRPSESAGMWDGWETRRRRGPGHDWASFRLGLPGEVELVVVDTTHFKGNAPGWVSIHFADDEGSWVEVVERHPVRPDTANDILIEEGVEASLIRLDIHPDGGVARLRAMGRPSDETIQRGVLRYLNTIPGDDVERFFRGACVTASWVHGMASARPYESVSQIIEQADRLFDGLNREEWLEAFAGHPRIGEKGDEVESREQAGTAGASKTLIDELKAVNSEYEERFGFTYIVYATGKSAGEMLEIARSRLSNEPARELEVAASAQREITRTRLRRLLCQDLTS